MRTDASMHLDGLAPWAGLDTADRDQPGIVVAGIPYDGSAVYRTGAALAPARLRELSAAFPPVTESGLSLASLPVHDVGDLSLGPSVETGWPAVKAALTSVRTEALLTVLGGDHCSTIPVLAAQAARHPGLVVVWIDAHPDLCDLSRGGRWTCGCALRRGLEVAGLNPRDVVVVGSRDYDAEELVFAREHGLRLVSIAEVARDPLAVGREIARQVGSRPLHISFDIDVLDPAFAPGTEIPSAGGLTTRQALELLAGLTTSTYVVGLDVAEVCPPADHSDITTLAALKVIFELWGMTHRDAG